MKLEHNVPLDEIEPPERDEKLHPYEDEEDEKWEEFKESVGLEPNNPIDVVEKDGIYEVVDGDRRLHALEENGAESTTVMVKNEGEIPSDAERSAMMIVANEHRKPSNKFKRSWHVAQHVAPWLLPPGERMDVEQIMTQDEFATEVSKSQGTISSWLSPMKEEHPLRTVLGDIVREPTKEDIETIDNIIELLVHGGDDGNRVVPMNQESALARQISDMEGLSLGEIETASEKAVEENWNMKNFAEYLREEFAYEEDEGHVSSGIVGGGQMADTTPTAQGQKGQIDEDDILTPDSDGQRSAAEDGDVVSFEKPSVEVDWSDYVSDEDIPGDTTLAEIENRKIMSHNIQDEACVAINLLSEVTGEDKGTVMETLVEPKIVDAAISYLNDIKQEKVEQ